MHASSGSPCAADDDVLRQLYARYGTALRRYAERFCVDPANAEDIVQETFIRAWRNLPQLTAEDAPVRPWLSGWRATC